MSVIEKSQRITKFLDSGLWHLGADRVVTRRAVFENLMKLPDWLLEKIFIQVNVLLFAPAAGQAATMVPYTVERGSPPIRYAVIYLDARIETYESAKARAVVSEALKSAFASVAGIERQASPEAANATAADGGVADSEVKQWGPN